MKQKIFCVILLLFLLCIGSTSAIAQTYRFIVEQDYVNVYINQDGTASIEYTIDFTNDINADPIDFVDIGLPNNNYDLNSITANINGMPINDIEDSPYVTYGFALGLGANAIQPGASGSVYVYIPRVSNLLYIASEKEAEEYASFEFSPNYFGSEYVIGNTDVTVALHLPPGIEPEEPRYFNPKKWPGESEPQSGYDADGRVYYTWNSSEANSYTEYIFGASFPARLVPEDTISRPPSAFEKFFSIIFNEDNIVCCCMFLFFGGFFGLIIYSAVWGQRKRKMQYLPPKIKIEGHGIKRGLTAIEAAILMEEPMDKILTMMLFSTVRKEAATVISQDPLKIETPDVLPENLHDYETEFLEAMQEENKAKRSRLLQEMMIKQVKSVTNKMKGFSRKETITYYKDIIRKAWHEVETAETPDVKMEKYEEVMDWTLLDKKYDERTRETFGTGPVFVPIWWGRYDPTFGRSTASTSVRPAQTPVSGGGKQISMPSLPGSNFAASMVNGVQAFSAGVVGNLTSFTDGITSKTNPVPKTTSSGSFRGGGGGGGCACACACAGCACACAGGGR